MDLGMFGPVRGGRAQHEERAELGQGLDSGLALHLLRFIEDEDRPVGSTHIDRFARLEIIQRVINPAVILAAGVERLDVHHHPIQTGIGRSEERREGKEVVSMCRSRWLPDRYNRKSKEKT